MAFPPKLLVQAQETEIEACFLREDEQLVMASAQSFPDVASSHPHGAEAVRRDWESSTGFFLFPFSFS